MSEEQKTAVETARDKAEAAAVAENATRTGIGPRQKVGATRGKNPQVITFESFDDSLPDSLPKTVESFMEVTKATTQEALVDYLIRGYNAASYESASDPLAEYVVASWDAQVQLTFRTAVRNYSKGLGIALEDAVAIIRPGFTAKFGE